MREREGTYIMCVQLLAENSSTMCRRRSQQKCSFLEEKFVRSNNLAALPTKEMMLAFI